MNLDNLSYISKHSEIKSTILSLSALDSTEIGGLSPFIKIGYSPLNNRMTVLSIL